MFYTILFVLACYNLYTNVKSFIKEHVVVENGAIAEIPKKAYIHQRKSDRPGRQTGKEYFYWKILQCRRADGVDSSIKRDKT